MPMTEWILRILGSLLLGLVAAGLFWRLRRDQAAGVVKRQDELGNDLKTLDRTVDPAAFGKHVMTQYLLMGLMIILALAVLMIRV